MEANLSNLIPSRYQGNTHPQISENRQKHNDDHDSHHNRKYDTISISQQAMASYSEQQSRESHIEITTRDGDIVTIDLSTSYNYQSGYNYSNQQTKNSSEIQLSAYESTQSSLEYQFSVQGHLDKDEREAIEDLVKDIGKVAKEIYQGDANAAFEHAVALEYDTDELQSYQFDISQSRSRQYTAAYEEVAQLESKEEYRPAIENNFSDLIEEFKEKLEDDINALRDSFQSKPLSSLVKQTADFFESTLEDRNPLHELLDTLLDDDDD